jgi:neutral amino acid transport system permease protein
MQGYIISILIFTATYGVFALGLNLQWGYTGLLNFGHVAFMAIGAYTTALISSMEIPGLPLWLQIPLAVFVGAFFSAGLGLLMGFATLRLRTDYLAIVTIGVSEIVRLIAKNETWLTRGNDGLQRYPLPLEGFVPPLPLRFVMLAVLLVIVAVGYLRGWCWLRKQLKAVDRRSIYRAIAPVVGYLVSLGILLVGIGLGAQQMKQSPAISNGVSGVILLGVLIGVGFIYTTLARRFLKPLPAWDAALTLVISLVLAGLGIWLTGIAAIALVTYARSPVKISLMWLSLLVLALVFLALQVLVHSPWGRVLKAIREDEEVAKALGKNVFWYKLQVLMLGGFIAGIAGSLSAWQLAVVYPENFRPLVTFDAWTIVVLGGAGSNLGTLFGTAIFWGYQALTRFILPNIVPLDDAQLGAFRVMLIGLLLMVMMMWRPQGMLGNKEELTLGR